MAMEVNEHMDNLAWLAAWYGGQCDGSWEHHLGLHLHRLQSEGCLSDKPAEPAGLAARHSVVHDAGSHYQRRQPGEPDLNREPGLNREPDLNREPGLNREPDLGRGWRLVIELAGTNAAGRSPRALELHSIEEGGSWLRCSMTHSRFDGAGDPDSLEQIIGMFRRWVDGTPAAPDDEAEYAELELAAGR